MGQGAGMGFWLWNGLGGMQYPLATDSSTLSHRPIPGMRGPAARRGEKTPHDPALF